MLGYLILSLVLCFLYWRYRDGKRITNVFDKYVYITGCDSGFGNLLAQHLDQQGFHVLAACFTEKGAEELKSRTSSRLKTFQLDVTNSESIGKAAEFVKSEVKGKGLWGLVNSAGILHTIAPVDWLTISDFKPALNVNLIGLIEVTLSVLPLIKRARGRIVNIASIFGRISLMSGPYCISKFGVEAFNDYLRRDIKCFGVKVACIEPGSFKTPLTDTDHPLKQMYRLWSRLPPEVREDYGVDYMDKVSAKSQTKMLGQLNPDLMKVVWCLNHALISLHPRTRYSAGTDAKCFWIPLSYMPTAISDFLISLYKTKPAKALF
ncbi:dehydrogenase/reductase SDR family member 9-like isoform X1 [Hypanus sabinus]|uniref:dehydrogenase/reductase SDR family member 9-like isoform X1 n=1 Tax=Hypanus sabinus TaxID=79690 RepID=UPI0028C4D49F|nr:dehydrogenase/reductase SDR family member 9-like isoform X1 [Hypanus sabinus]